MEQFSFGLFADPQYADKPMNINRFYRSSLRKMAECVELFRQGDVDFAVCLGDLIDGGETPCRSQQACLRMQAIVSGLGRPCHYVLGNHDVNAVSRFRLMELWGHPGQEGYYAFAHKGVLFVVLDTNRDDGGMPYPPGRSHWDRSHVGEAQLAWLEALLAASREEWVIVLAHAPLDDLDNPHVARDAPRARRVLERSGKRIAVYQGHMHSGYASRANGIRYHTLKGMVDTERGFDCWIVTVSDRGVAEEILSPGGSRRPALPPGA